MPAPNLGLVGAYGAAGVQKAIQDMVAERQFAQKLEEERAAREFERQMKERQFKLDQEKFGEQKRRSGVEEDVTRQSLPGEIALRSAQRFKIELGDPYESATQREHELKLAGMKGPSRGLQAKDMMVGGQLTATIFDPTTGQYFDQEMRPLPNVTPPPPRDPVMLIQTTDPQGRNVIQAVPQSQARGQTFSGQPSDAQQTQMAGLESGINLIQELRSQFQPSYVGPIEGRARPVGQKVGLTGPPGQARFYAAAAGLENDIVRLITGAAVGVQEEARIMKEIPRITDPDDVFLEKLTQTERNRTSLLEAIRRRTTGGGTGGGGKPKPKPGGGGEDWERGPDGKLRRKGGE